MTQTKVSKTERLLNLISFMLKSRRPVPFSRIAGHVVGYDDEARLDSIEKRFDRDKAELRNMGIPVEYVDGGTPEASGYVIPRERFFLGQIQLDMVDAVILRMAGQSGVVAFGSPLMKEAFESAMRKLAVDSPELDEVPAIRASSLQLAFGHSRVTEILQTVCAAVWARRTIAFDYVNREGVPSRRRRVDPYGLGIDRGEWYLVGRAHDADEVRCFRLSRIVGTVSLTGASDAVHEFDIPAGFRVEDHLFREPWEYGQSEPVEVRLRVPRDLALQLRHQSLTRFVFEDGSENDPSAESSDLLFEARSPRRMIDWILSLGPEVQVLGPPELRAQLAERLEELAAVYGDGGSAS